jgi:hypothetical protein
MIDPKTIELMNRVLDGAATEPERADLDRTLTASPEARAHYEALGRLVRKLDSVPLDEPPAYLHPRVIEGVERSGVHYSAKAGDERGFLGWFHRMVPTFPLRYASTFGLGLAAGAVILAVARGSAPTVDPSQVSGTIVTPAGVPMLVEVPEAGVSGSVAVVDRGPTTQVRLLVDKEGGTEWVIDVPNRAEPSQSVVIRVVKSGETVFEEAVHPVEP